jgi:hypothetical protein
MEPIPTTAKNCGLLYSIFPCLDHSYDNDCATSCRVFLPEDKSVAKFIVSYWGINRLWNMDVVPACKSMSPVGPVRQFCAIVNFIPPVKNVRPLDRITEGILRTNNAILTYLKKLLFRCFLNIYFTHTVLCRVLPKTRSWVTSWGSFHLGIRDIILNKKFHAI